MKVLRAETLGMCFGVRDALTMMDGIQEPDQVTIHGELVHNEHVLAMLARRGFSQNAESSRIVPATPQVLITAHGISERERQRLEEANKQLIDTTCPLVIRVHESAQRLARTGHHVVVLGKPGHVEVQGIVEDLPSTTVIASPSDAEALPYDRIGVVSQTTMAVADAEAIVAALVAHNPHAEVHVEDTICSPTRQRGEALEKLLATCDVLVVVGGRNSNNTRQLAVRATRHGVPAHHVQGARDLCEEWFTGCDIVGLTAGTSTLERTIAEVEGWLLRCGQRQTPLADHMGSGNDMGPAPHRAEQGPCRQSSRREEAATSLTSARRPSSSSRRRSSR